MIRVISGGQTGVDRAGLDAALAAGLPVGGWCPCGRLAEDGPIAAHYPLCETPSRSYAQRTRWNVRDADATLILAQEPHTGGTLLTQRVAQELRRPLLVVDPHSPETHLETARLIRTWLDANGIVVLNIAGPRESTCPGVYSAALALLTAAFDPSPAPRSRRPASRG